MPSIIQGELESGQGTPAAAFLRPAEVAARYPLTANHLGVMRHRKTGPRYIRRGKLVLYRPSDVEEWLLDGLTDPVSRKRVSA